MDFDTLTAAPTSFGAEAFAPDGVERHARGHVPVLPDFGDLGDFDLSRFPCDPELGPLMTPETAIALSAVLHSRVGRRLVVATSRPDLCAEIQRMLPGETVMIAKTSPKHILAAIGAIYGDGLARVAETRAPLSDSSRIWSGAELSLCLGLPLVGFAIWAAVAPVAAFGGLFAFAFMIFFLNVALKIAAVAQARRGRSSDDSPEAIQLFKEPTITLLLPLFQEKDVVGSILPRLEQLDYPRERLDVIFILEEGDQTTRAALDTSQLPNWARAIVVPKGHPQTKPRALNYALPFARGTIIGIYDAEDAPEPDQLRRVARGFANAPPDVACLQGQLDYYNAGHNLMSRCFTIEYASWFRLLLPGVARMGLVVPLGGTTLFLKREAINQVGAWDAHNVTEDAELGIRLHRHGYRTELLETTTFEEANSAIWPWIRQRSRWLKGYAITWATVMRDPVRLWHDLGAWRFFGLQAQFAGTVIGFVTAPLLWSLAVIPLGLPHPVAPFLSPLVTGALTLCFVAALVTTIGINWMACEAAHLRRHRAWVLVMLIYYPLGSVAAVLALFDLAVRPFYWAKTAHGRYGLVSSNAPASSFRRTSKARLR